MMWFGISAVLISFVLALLLFYVRVQPPTVIRIAANGDATVVSGATTTPRTPLGFMNALAASSAARRAARRHRGPGSGAQIPGKLPDVHTDHHGEELGRRVKHDDAQPADGDAEPIARPGHRSKVHDDEITSTFKLRSLEPVKGQPWTYVAFGVKEVHRVHNKTESTDRLVARYNVRLLQTERSERVPSGLLVAEYGEQPDGGRKGQRAWSNRACSRTTGRSNRFLSRLGREDAYLARFTVATGTPARGDAW